MRDVEVLLENPSASQEKRIEAFGGSEWVQEVRIGWPKPPTYLSYAVMTKLRLCSATGLIM